MVIKEIKIREWYDRIKVHLKRNYDEVMGDLYGEYNPDIDLYFQLEDEGSIQWFLAFDKEGNIKGHASLIMNHYHHSKDIKVGVIDNVYSHNKSGLSTVGMRLIAHIEKYCKERKINKLSLSSNNDRVIEMLKKIGYNKTETCMVVDLWQA